MTTTTTTAELLLQVDGLDLTTMTPQQGSDLQQAQKRQKVRLWTVTARSGSTVVVRTTGGLQGEAKKAARVAAYNVLQSGNLSADLLWLNTLAPQGVEWLAGRSAVAVAVS